MNDDRVGSGLKGLGDRLTQDLDVPRYENIERRRSRRRRGRGAAGLVAGVVVIVAAVGFGPLLVDRGSGTPVGARPQPTVTVPAAVHGALTLRDVSFVDANTNVALGQRCNEQGECDTVVLRSADDGQSFGDEHVVTRVGVVGPTKVVVGAGNMLIAYDPGFYVSRDGGESWRNLTPPGYAIKDVATRGKTFTALGVSIDGRAELLQTPAAEIGRGSFVHLPIDGADASARLQQDGDGAELVTVGSDATGSTEPAQILVRAAGSSSWSHVRPPQRCVSPSFSAPKPTSWWLVCAEAPTAGGLRTKTAFFSDDRGLHWRTLAPPPAPGEGGTVTGVGATQAYLSGPDTPLYVTRDGGQSWQQAIGRAPAGFGEPHVLPDQSWVVSGSMLWRMGVDGVWRGTALS